MRVSVHPGRLAPLVLATAVVTASLAQGAAPAQVLLESRTVPVTIADGLRFKDLNRSGQLDPYEDWRLPPETRARDLVARMTLPEKAGAMMHGTLPLVQGAAGYDTARATQLFVAGVNSAISRLQATPAVFAEQSNELQALAEQTRLGIPLTVSSDPRHHFQVMTGASEAALGFSQWPELIGFAALRDAPLMQRFAAIARDEYRAVGIHMALSPQADLATEPRWSRINGTFGEDPEVARRLVAAYVAGMQDGHSGVGRSSVAAVVKHWAGYGAAKLGLDSHNHYGRFAIFPGGGFAQHLVPFEGAFAARVAGVMPTYSILVGAGPNPDQVGGGYNRWLLQDLLRGRYRFDGLILSDWGITNDCGEICREGFPPGAATGPTGFSTAWGVEHLSRAERFARGVEAGLDQFGGTEDAPSLVTAVRLNLVAEAQLDRSAQRVMEIKFRQGLFENPYVDVARATRFVGNAQLREEGLAAQRRALVLLQNRGGLLPLSAARRVYLHGIDAGVARSHGFEVASRIEDASLAIVRTAAPHETLYPTFWFGSRQHDGALDFRPGHPDLELIARLAANKVPTIVTVYLDRPAILTGLRAMATALIANFGVSDATLFDVLTGKAQPEGRLPFELPSSMAEVAAQASDLPHDTERPLYPIGYGLRY